MVDSRIPMRLAAVFILYTVVLASYSLAYTGSLDVTAFIHAGENQTLLKGIQYDGVYVYPGLDGYDGQYYYHIARNPFNIADVARIESPQYRYQRILYPLLVYVLSLGQASAVPYVMLAVNLACVLAAAYLYMKWAGRHWFYAAFIPGVFVSVILDLAEPLWFLLTLAALWASSREEHWGSAFLFGPALFTKEMTLFIVAPLGLAYILKRRYREAAPYALLAIPFLAWQLTLLPLFGKLPVQHSGRFVFSGTGYVEAFTAVVSNPSLHKLPVPLLQLSIIPAAYVAYRALKRKTPLAYALAFNAAVVFLFQKGLWVDLNAAARNILPLSTMLLAYYAVEHDGRIHYAAAPQIIVTAAAASFYVVKAFNAVF